MPSVLMICPGVALPDIKKCSVINHNCSYLLKCCMPRKQQNFLVNCIIFAMNSHQIFNHEHFKSFVMH